MKLKKKTAAVKTKTQKVKRKPYFGKAAHNAVVQYQAAELRKDKNNIYIKEIKPSFEKLAENLIYIHGFSQSKDHFTQLKCDCVSFLYEILEKFDPARGSKAFSYFNVCAKNYLIIQSKKRLKEKKRNVSIDDVGLSMRDKIEIEQHQVIDSPENIFIQKEEIKALHEMNRKIRDKVTNANEKLCIEAIISLFNNINDLDFLNKRAVFVYLRELSGLNAKQLSVAMSGIRKQYRDISKNNDEYKFFKR